MLDTAACSSCLPVSYHLKLHHLPFPKLIELAMRGKIPKRLATLKGRTPVCVACIFGTAHRKPWRIKSKKYNPIRRPEDDAPGKRISTDQLVSAQPGLIPQMSGFLTIGVVSNLLSSLLVSNSLEVLVKSAEF